MKPAEYVPLEGYERYHEDDMRSRIRAMADKLASRRSIRDFASTPVPRDIIETAIRTAGSAPSGANHQPWYFVAISNPDIKRKIRLAAEAEERAFYAAKAGAEWLEALVPLGTNPDKPFLETAPWLIAVFAQRRGGVRAGMNTKNYYVTES
ncbi:MAG TPA: nitroreductase family protein, partial [Rhizobiales bacterium]|nr:nitroreductase family protein [Hyphomicrobiales bacterium]